TRYWNEVSMRLANAGLDPNQVQVIWLKQVIADQSGPKFPQNAQKLEECLLLIVERLKQEFVNLRIIYVSSRTYGGWVAQAPGGNGTSREPGDYESAFAYKWLIEKWEETMGADDPWIAWGPYLWADGDNPRGDGFTWNLQDVLPDHLHPSAATGRGKIALLLSGFFKTSPTSKGWYLKNP
ncbi:MAG: hypothetical protein FWE85_03990, partial [Clostridiales bacterium]|nr:hypothetical protein [Clostridiales bacterium]